MLVGWLVGGWVGGIRLGPSAQHSIPREAPTHPPPQPSHLRVELKVDDLAAAERNGHLPLVGGGALDGLAAGGAPLVDAAVGADVAQAIGVDLGREVGRGCLK